MGTRMNNAQIGLLVAAPVIVVFAIALRLVGALRTTGAVAAILMSIAIAAVMLFS
jgi:hypothetical protein